MSRNIIIVLISHCHKLLDLICETVYGVHGKVHYVNQDLLWINTSDSLNSLTMFGSRPPCQISTTSVK
jgi:hypothetical protein